MITRILYVCPSSGIGGVETFLQSTAKGHSPDFEPHYFLFRQGPLLDTLVEMGKKVFVLESPPRLSKAKDRKRVRKAIINYAKKHSCHAIHGSMAYGALFSSAAAKTLNIPFVWFQHGPASGWMDRWAGLKNHEGIIYNSQYTKEKQKQLEAPLIFLIPKPRKELILPLGTSGLPQNFPDSAMLRKNFLISHDLPEDTVLFSMLCRIQSWKGVHHFLAALRILKKKSPHFRGFIWGDSFRGDQYLSQLKTKAQDENIPVDFMGPTLDPLTALACTDVLVNASTQPEPFGLSIIEAMSCGKAVVAPNEGGPSEIIENNQSGLLFTPRSPDSLASAMEELLHSETLSKISQGGLERWKSNFQTQRMIERLEKFYLEMVNSKNKRTLP